MWYGKWRFSNCTRMIKTRKLKHAYNNFLILLVYFQKEVTLDTLRWFWITMDDKSFLCCCFFCFRYAKHPDNLEKWLNFKENLISKGYTGLMHRSKKNILAICKIPMTLDIFSISISTVDEMPKLFIYMTENESKFSYLQLTF